LISDHGEAFGKHRYGGERMFFHGQTLYDELLRVPVVVAAPGQEARTVDDPAMLIDVAPTIAELMGVAPPHDFNGRSLAPYLAGQTLPPRPVEAELLPAPEWNHDAKMMIAADGRTKIIYRISDSLFELYDLVADPDEQKNLVDEKKDVAKKMKQAIATWKENLDENAGHGPPPGDRVPERPRSGGAPPPPPASGRSTLHRPRPSPHTPSRAPA